MASPADVPRARRPWLIAVLILFANFTYYASFAVLNSVLTDIAQDFDVSESSVLWVTTLPPLLGAAFTPTCGSLSDQFGRKRIWVAGYILNCLALGVAGTSSSLGMLLVARFMCGLGSAMENPTGSAIVLAAFPESRHGLLLGLMATVATVANSLGLLVGGIVTERFGWRALFLGPFVPVAAALFLAIYALPADDVKRDRAEMRRALRAFDWAGTVVFSTMITLFLIGINRGGADSFTSWPVVLCLCAAGLLFPLLLVVERRAKHAILPPALMASEPVALTLAYSFVRDVTYMLLFIIFPLYLRDLCGLDAATVSLLTFTRPLTSGFLGPLAGRLADSPRFPPHLVMTWSAFASIADKVTGAMAMWHGSVQYPTIYAFQSLQGGIAGVSGTASRLFVTGRTTSEHLGNVQGILSMFNFAAQTIGMDIGMALLASFPDSAGKPTLTGFRWACMAALVSYTLSLIMPACLSYRERQHPSRKVPIPPLHVRRNIAVHSMLLEDMGGGGLLMGRRESDGGDDDILNVSRGGGESSSGGVGGGGAAAAGGNGSSSGDGGWMRVEEARGEGTGKGKGARRGGKGKEEEVGLLAGGDESEEDGERDGQGPGEGEWEQWERVEGEGEGEEEDFEIVGEGWGSTGGGRRRDKGGRIATSGML